jgi:hypothetical protein
LTTQRQKEPTKRLPIIVRAAIVKLQARQSAAKWDAHGVPYSTERQLALAPD